VLKKTGNLKLVMQAMGHRGREESDEVPTPRARHCALGFNDTQPAVPPECE